MQVKQIAELMNGITNEILGKEGLVQEDLGNIVDVGREIFNATDVDNYVKKLVDHIGKVIFVNRIYMGTTPSVLMDSWEFGSVLEKVKVDKLPEAVENDSWKLENGKSYDPHVFHAPEISAKFYNSKTTFEVDMSYTEIQVKESFSSAAQLNAFISMIEVAVKNSIAVKTEAKVQRTINNAMGECIYQASIAGETGKPYVVNVLAKYNAKFGKNLTSEQAILDPGFIRYAAYVIGLYKDRLTKISTMFNVGGCERFTPTDKMHSILLSEFKRAADVYLQSDTYHEEYTKIADSEVVPYWQGPGVDYEFANTSAINIKTASGHEVSQNGILGLIFDRDALGVTNYNARVTSEYNPKAEFYTNFYKQDCGYFNDSNENVIVFIAA